jgi:hypothetical protein
MIRQNNQKTFYAAGPKSNKLLAVASVIPLPSFAEFSPLAIIKSILFFFTK